MATPFSVDLAFSFCLLNGNFLYRIFSPILTQCLYVSCGNPRADHIIDDIEFAYFVHFLITTPGIQAFNHFGFDACNFTNLLFKFWTHGNPSFPPKNIGYISNDPSNSPGFSNASPYKNQNCIRNFHPSTASS